MSWYVRNYKNPKKPLQFYDNNTLYPTFSLSVRPKISNWDRLKGYPLKAAFKALRQLPHTTKHAWVTSEEEIDNSIIIDWRGDQIYHQTGWTGNAHGTIIWCSFNVQEIKCTVFVDEHYFLGITDLFDEAFEQVRNVEQKGKGKGKGKKGKDDNQDRQDQDRDNQGKGGKGSKGHNQEAKCQGGKGKKGGENDPWEETDPWNQKRGTEQQGRGGSSGDTTWNTDGWDNWGRQTSWKGGWSGSAQADWSTTPPPAETKGKPKGKGKGKQKRFEFPWGTDRDYPFRIMLVKVNNWQQDEAIEEAEQLYNDPGQPSYPRFADPNQRSPEVERQQRDKADKKDRETQHYPPTHRGKHAAQEEEAEMDSRERVELEVAKEKSLQEQLDREREQEELREQESQQHQAQ